MNRGIFGNVVLKKAGLDFGKGFMDMYGNMKRNVCGNMVLKEEV